MTSTAFEDAEQIVIGAAMLDDSGVTAAGLRDTVTAADFVRPAHLLIWQAVAGAVVDGDPTGPVAIAHRLTAAGELGRVGGAPYLHTLIASVPTAAAAGYYARLVAEAATRRRAADAAARIAQAAQSPDADLAAVVDAARHDLTGAHTVGEAWPDPVPLTVDHYVPSFPTAVLPDWLADMVSGVATATQTPTDLAGSLALSCLSAATMGRVVVEPAPGWHEQTTLYTCTALGPGNRKSAVFDAIAAPIHAAEQHLAEELRPQIVEARVEKAIAVKGAEQALAAAGKDGGDPDTVNSAKTAANAAEELVVPTEPRLITTDATPEATKTLLAQQGGRLAILDDEGGIFAHIAGRYSGVPDLDAYLKGHSGGQLRIDRKSSTAEYVERAALTVGLAVQPSVLRDVATVPGFESRGLLARFLWSMPASMVGRRDPSPQPVAPAVRELYHRRLRDLAIAMWHHQDTVTLTLTPQARDRVIALERDREPRLAPGGEWEPILNWANKWTGAVVRIAGLLHIADNLATGWRGIPVDVDTIDAAALIGHYYAAHALAAWDYMHTAPTGPATTLLTYLQQQQQTTWTRRDLWRGLRRRLPRGSTDLDTALAVLADHGHIRIHQPSSPGRGRRPSPRIHTHPHITGGAR